MLTSRGSEENDASRANPPPLGLSQLTARGINQKTSENHAIRLSRSVPRAAAGVTISIFKILP